MRRPLLTWCLLLAALPSCARKQPLTAEIAESIIRSYGLRSEPVYAEVPQRVWWGPAAPKDDYDGKAVQTLRNLEKEGLVTLTDTHGPDGSAEYRARVTEKGFRVLGTAPSHRGPVFRGMIALKVYDGVRNFQRHPTEETTGHAELVWHYDHPTPLYPLFETKINKPLRRPFVSHVSFFFKDHAWRFDVTVPKVEAEP
ncbi:MAG TPA: hypothetical protein VNA04_12285 [Thermoanaerobaculia bacterium]|nr:hypothetical protein [Thermoanaerobaculia bacterium]